jgi:hypothetical protein
MGEIGDLSHNETEIIKIATLLGQFTDGKRCGTAWMRWVIQTGLLLIMFLYLLVHVYYSCRGNKPLSILVHSGALVFLNTIFGSLQC